MNAKYIKAKKYLAEGDYLEQIRKQLDLPLKRMGEFFKRHKIKKISSKSYIEMERGRRAFSKDRYEEVALAFCKEFNKRGLLINVPVEDLYQQEEELKQKTIFLNQIKGGQDLIKNLEKADKKKTLNLSSIKQEHQELVKNLFGSIESFLQGSTRVDASENWYSADKENLGNFSSEVDTMDTLINFDECINKLQKKGLYLYCGILPAYLAELYVNGEICVDHSDPSNYIAELDQYEHPEQISKKNIKRLELIPQRENYIIMYFSNKTFRAIKLAHQTFLTSKKVNKINSNEEWVIKNYETIPETSTPTTLKTFVSAHLVNKLGYMIPQFLLGNELEITPMLEFDPLADYQGDLKDLGEFLEENKNEE